MDQPLKRYRVLDMTHGVAGPFGTQILADLGAEVIKIEPPNGDESRGKPEKYAALNRGKKSVTADLNSEEDRNRILEIACDTDILVEDLGPHRADLLNLGYQDICAVKPDIIYISITGYGHDGIFSSYSDSDAIVQALSGIMSITGQEGGTFTKVGFPVADVFTGIHAAISALAGILYRRKNHIGLYADIAKLSVMLAAMPDSLAKFLNTGRISRPKGSRHQLVGFFQPVKTKDGHVTIMAAQDHQFAALIKVLGLEGLDRDERFNNMFVRCINALALEEIIQAKTTLYTTDELMTMLLENKIAAGPIYPLETTLSGPYVKSKDLIIQLQDAQNHLFKSIGFPVRFDKFSTSCNTFLSEKGAYNSVSSTKASGSQLSCDPDAHGKPLSGIRILDLTLFMAGPLGIEILENLGAEIVKVEREDTISDFARTTEPTFGTTSAYFVSLNGGKKDIALDLKSSSHRDLLLRLAEKCDVFAENFRPGVTERLGITYEDILKVNPSVIYSSVSGFGQTGPFSRRGCVDTVAQGMSGLMSITTRKDESPIRVGTSISDVCAALFESVGILAAIVFRDENRAGIHVDTAMLSTMLYAMNIEATECLNCGTKIRGNGNQDRENSLFDAYPTLNGDVMIDASSSEDFEALLSILNLEELRTDPRYCNSENRSEFAKNAKEMLFQKTRTFSKTKLADLCRSKGIPAGEVFTQEEICRSGYAEERGLIKIVRDSLEGSFKVIGHPVRYDKFRTVENSFTPQPGEHTVKVLRELLEMSEQEISDVIKNKTI